MLASKRYFDGDIERDIEACSDTMDLRRIIPTDVTASAIAHLSVLALVFLFSDVHPFGSVTAEPIAVDIVTPQEIAGNTGSREEGGTGRRANAAV